MSELETLKVDAYNLMVKITKAKSELEMMWEEFNRVSEAIDKLENPTQGE